MLIFAGVLVLALALEANHRCREYLDFRAKMHALTVFELLVPDPQRPVTRVQSEPVLRQERPINHAR